VTKKQKGNKQEPEDKIDLLEMKEAWKRQRDP
jgi:hypothetical protein